MHQHPTSDATSQRTLCPRRSLRPISALLLAAMMVAVAACDDDAVAPPAGSAQATAATAAASAEELPWYLVGAYYASLWWREPSTLAHFHNQDSSGTCVNADGTMAEDWRPCYRGRQPLVKDVLGDEFPDDRYTWYDDRQRYVDEQIKMAAAGGIDFFAFEYFPEQKDDGQFVGSQKNNNNGLKFFMNSRNRHLMRFALLYVNLDKFAIELSDEEYATEEAAIAAWQDTVRGWVNRYFKHPRYLTINNKPVLIIINATGMAFNWGSDESAKARLNDLRVAADTAGFDGVLIGAVSRPDPFAINRMESHGYDFLTGFSAGFLDPGSGNCDPSGQFAGETDYALLTGYMDCLWGLFRTHAPDMPYAPVVVQGWDRRPTGKPFDDGSDEPYLVNKTPELFAQQLRAARRFVDANPRLPSSSADGQRMVVIYAWNELGEGGTLIPNKGERFHYLNRVKGIFD